MVALLHRQELGPHPVLVLLPGLSSVWAAVPESRGCPPASKEARDKPGVRGTAKRCVQRVHSLEESGECGWETVIARRGCESSDIFLLIVRATKSHHQKGQMDHRAQMRVCVCVCVCVCVYTQIYGKRENALLNCFLPTIKSLSSSSSH